ncbi:PREDICTED: probable cytochrome P450 6a14 [Polistes dominula]|uniref:Probable cytochrome P450 6a14 n=1 Tax=Polistes dominula TaxID=743375 RepID=A0ABM1IQC6_POLDO|nr:PREDICTED: probable cytochrome P450 6a14 [Polistes dominula]XP_015182413.1 PREDICTED: probable cytochrome P450 6a14 [Polistes dominula]
MAIYWILSELIYILIFIIIGIYLYYKFYICNYWSKRGIPFEKPKYFIEKILDIVCNRKTFGEIFAEMYFEYKKFPYVGIFMAHSPNLLINDPELIRFVLVEEFSNFQDRGLYINENDDPLTGNLFLLTGKKWRTMRTNFATSFSNAKLKNCMFEIFLDKGYVMEEVLADKAKNKSEINVKDIGSCFFIDLIMAVAYGIESNCLEDSKSEFAQWGRTMFKSKPFRTTLLLFIPKLFDILPIKYNHKNVTKLFLKTFKATIEYRKMNNIVKNDLLNLIMQMMDDGYVEYDRERSDEQKEIKKLTVLEGAAHFFGYIIGGYESPSTTISFCLYELALNQEIQHKARKEIDTIIEKHNGITYDAINEMSYLQMVILETLRKYPTLPVMSRVCNKDIQLANYNVVVPKGTKILIPTLGIQRNPEYYPEPDKFIPERFSEEEIRSRHKYIYLPFGEGPRICPGLRYGIVALKVALVNALRKYEYSPGTNTPTKISYVKGSFTLGPENGMYLQIQLRK